MHDLAKFNSEDEDQCLNSFLFISTINVVVCDEAKQRSVLRMMLTN
jgi:hypothetical protein